MEVWMTTALYEPTSADFGVRRSEIYRELRDYHRVYRDPADQFYALSRFDDVIEASLDWQTFSSEGRVDANYAKPSMHMMDPPRQPQLRSIVGRAFTPRRIARLESRMREIAGGLIDRFIATGQCD